MGAVAGRHGGAGPVRARWPVATIAVSAGLAVFALRMLALVGFPNDQFVSLARAAQVLLGEWPIRDFVDPGAPLTYLASAAALAVGGRTLLSEAVLVALAFGVAAALTVVVVQKWTGSIVLGIWAASTEAMAFPRPYSYPKILLYIGAAGVLLAYVEKPSRRRLAVVAVMVAVAFLFRHDHGVNIGLASAATLLVLHACEGWRAAARTSGLWALVLLLLLAPFLIYVQVHFGLLNYLAVGLDVSRVEALRTFQGWPDPAAFAFGDPDQHAAVLYYGMWALTLSSAGAALFRGRIMSAPQLAIAVGVAVLAATVNAGFLRDPLDARIPDAIVPAVLLLSWLAALAFAGKAVWNRMAQLAVVLVMAGGTVAVARVGRFPEQLDRAGLKGGLSGVRARAHEVVAELREPFAEAQMPSDFAFALVPFFRYVQACTPPHARLLVTGFAPEVPFYAGRGFAGGHPVLYAGFHASPQEQRETLLRMARQTVPFVVVPPDRYDEFRRLYPDVETHVRTSYRPLAEVAVDGFTEPSRIFVRSDLPPAGEYGPQKWPCFR